MPRGNFEPKDPRTGKGIKHQEAALRGNKNKGTPKIDFEESMYIGHRTENSGPEFMQIKMRISNTGDSNEISMSGVEGEIMRTDILEKRVQEYWSNMDLEEEYGYLADEAIGEEPDEDDIDKEMPFDVPDPDEDEDGYNDVRDVAYEDAKTALKERREEYLEGIKDDLIAESHPWEYYNEERINGEYYTLTIHSAGQVLDRAKEYTPIIHPGDLDYIVKAWQKHHLFGMYSSRDSKLSEPTLETMQTLIGIYKQYQSEGGDKAHIEKIVTATGI